MHKAEKKFRLYAMLAVFVLLTVLLAVINCVSFTMTSTDADDITREIADLGGSFTAQPQPPSGEPAPPSGEARPPRQGSMGWLGPMGPTSPETRSSLRYFTIAFSETGETVRIIAFKISAVTVEEAEGWARSLLPESTGWTGGTYRYRVYELGELTCVTVIDQGRELLAFYRILIISGIGEALCLLLVFLVLTLSGRRIFAPLAEADRKQKKFIAEANRNFRLPITIIGAETELLEKDFGPNDRTRSIHRQVHKMSALVSQLDGLAIFEPDASSRTDIQLSDLLRAVLDQRAEDFAARDLKLEADIAPDVLLRADPEAIRRVVDELVENALKYAISRVSFQLRKESDRVILQARNDTDLPDGPVEQVFDRFTTLANGAAQGSPGLGLAFVKDIVRAHDGRATASVADGSFTLRIAL